MEGLKPSGIRPSLIEQLTNFEGKMLIWLFHRQDRQLGYMSLLGVQVIPVGPPRLSCCQHHTWCFFSLPCLDSEHIYRAVPHIQGKFGRTLHP